MIDVKIIEAKLLAEEEVKKAKLWLAHKEVVGYTTWKAQPENEKDRTAQDKVIAKLKLEDEEWMGKEEALVYQEARLKSINLIVETLQNTLRAMGSHPEITKDYFDELQDAYMNQILSEVY